MSYFPETDWEIVIPTEAENLVANPSVENNTTNYTAVIGAVLTRTNADQYWGAYSLKADVTTENSGFYFTTSDVVVASGTAYNYSFYANVPDGKNMIAYVASTVGVAPPQHIFDFVGTGYWQRYTFPLTADTSAQKRLYIVTGDNDGSDTFSWYTDGLMFVSGADDQTYIDGDQDGCEWNGAQHASTSTRDDSHRLGGIIYNLSHYGLGLKQQTGIGMVTPTHITQEYGNQDGALYQGTINRPRIFQLTTQLLASGTDTLANLHMQRDAIINAVKINLVGQQSELLLRYTGGNTVREIKVLYDEGLGFNATNVYQEVLPLRFLATDPYFYGEGESAKGLTSAVTISGAYVSQRNKDGQWSHLNSTFNSAVWCVAFDETRNLYYFGGSFTTPNTRITKYDPDAGTFTLMGTGAADGTVFALWVDQTTGDVYAGGSFSSMGGVARTKGIARWDHATLAWKAVASGTLNGQVSAITQGNDRTVYFGGTFTLMSGISNTVRIARFNPTTGVVSAMGTGMDLDVSDIAISPDGYPYVIGYFSTGNGVTLNGLGRWTGSTFAAIGTGLNASPDGESIGFGKDSSLYAGVFNSITPPGGSLTIPFAGRWNGSQWLALGTGLDFAPYVWKRDKKGLVYAAGVFSTAGGLTLPSPVTFWNGSQWYPIGLKSSNMGSDSSRDMHIRNNDVITIVFNNPNVTLTEAVTTVTNDGSADVYPRIVIDGPSSGTAIVYFIKNYTTGDTIYFNTALTLNAGERWTLDLSQNGKSFNSTFQGNIFSKIVPGSNIGKFRLISGANKISVFSNTTGLTINAIWQDRYLSADGGARLA